MPGNPSPKILNQSALMAVYSIKSSPNDVESINSTDSVRVGIINGYHVYAEPKGRAVNVEDEDEPSKNNSGRVTGFTLCRYI